MFNSVGTGEILVILLIVLLLFGSKELPQMARKLGKGYRDFQRVTQNARDEMKKIMDDVDRETRDVTHPIRKEFDDVKREIHRSIDEPGAGKPPDRVG
jgi:sec-independent protein translocase protein TatA